MIIYNILKSLAEAFSITENFNQSVATSIASRLPISPNPHCRTKEEKIESNSKEWDGVTQQLIALGGLSVNPQKKQKLFHHVKCFYGLFKLFSIGFGFSQISRPLIGKSSICIMHEIRFLLRYWISRYSPILNIANYQFEDYFDGSRVSCFNFMFTQYQTFCFLLLHLWRKLL